MSDVLIFKRNRLPNISFGNFNVISKCFNQEIITLPNDKSDRILIIYANESLVDIYVNEEYYDELNGTVNMLIKKDINVRLECKDFKNIIYLLIVIN